MDEAAVALSEAVNTVDCLLHSRIRRGDIKKHGF